METINVSITIAPSDELMSFIKKIAGVEETAAPTAKVSRKKSVPEPEPEPETTIDDDDFLAADEVSTEEITLEAIRKLAQEKAGKSPKSREAIKKAISSFGAEALKDVKKGDYARLYMKLEKI